MSSMWMHCKLYECHLIHLLIYNTDINQLDVNMLVSFNLFRKLEYMRRRELIILIQFICQYLRKFSDMCNMQRGRKFQAQVSLQ